jgi:hypothetical protein
MKSIAFALVLLAGGIGTVLATDSPLAGTWNLNVKKSKLSGTTFTYSATATGFQYSNGSTIKYDFATDGKDYPAGPGRTVSWIKSGDNAWDSVWKDEQGTTLSKVRRVLSADGKTMTVSIISYRADGTTSEETDVRARLSGGPGLAGTWKEVKITAAADTMIISEPSAGHLKLAFPRDKQFVDAPIDGTPSPFQGPSVADGAMVSLKLRAANQLEWSYAVKGTVMQQGLDTVSADGKSLTSISWPAGKDSEKITAVYDRQ